MHETIIVLSQAIAAGQPAVLATVVAVNGASPAKTGAQITLQADGTAAGTLGGGNLEAAVLADARAVLESAEPRLARYALTPTGPDAVGTLCGGEVS